MKKSNGTAVSTGSLTVAAEPQKSSKKADKTKTKRSAHDLDSEDRPSKKQKPSKRSKSNDASESGNQAKAVATTEPTENEQALKTPQKSQAVQRNRRKSVTFTPDTKAEDGFTGQAYFKDWAANQKKQQTDQKDEEEQPQATQLTKEEKKLAKQEKKQAKQAKESENLAVAAASTTETGTPRTFTPREAPDYVHYLEQFHTDQANWKFNKRKQNDLLKNALNLWRIPAKHNEALIAYVAGLKGAQAQHRLLDSAEAVLQEILKREGRMSDIDDLLTRKERNMHYEAAIQRDLARIEKEGFTEREQQSIDELKNRREREDRAEAILMELLPKELGLPPILRGPPPPPQPSDEPVKHYMTSVPPTYKKFDDDDDLPPLKKDAPPKKRSRKARTDVSSSSSSDDSSDDSSSDDSSSEDEKKSSKTSAKKPREKIFDKELLDKAFPATVKKSKSKAQPDSSESESSSSSESESDSSEDED